MKVWSFFRHHIIGIVVVLVVLLGVWIAVARLRPPGSMTVLQAQGMSARSSASIGTTPVAVETVERRSFAPTVTYTGTAVAYNDVQIYPRVTGRLVALNVYPGDQVRVGQVVARLDSAELTSRAREASAGAEAALGETGAAYQERRQAISTKRAADAKVRSARNAVRDAQAQVQAAQAMRRSTERDVAAAQAAVANAEADITAAQADVDYWTAQIGREQALYQRGAESGEEYQRARAQAQTARAKLVQAKAGVRERQENLSAAQARIEQAQAGITSAQARQEQAASDYQGALADASAAAANIDLNNYRIQQRRAQLQQATAQQQTAGIVRGYTEIRADQEGIVTERLVSPGTLVQPGTPILHIQKTDPIRLQANVSAVDLAGIHVGVPVTITSQQDANVLMHTRVTSIFNAANPQSRTVIVEALTPNRDHRFVPGQYIVMQIATANASSAITIPVTAVAQDEAQRSFVWTAVHGPHGQSLAHRVYTKLGASDGRRVLVRSGLREGNQVIVRGQESLNEGTAVTPTAWGSSGPLSLPPPVAAPGMPGMPGMGQNPTAPAQRQPRNPPSRPGPSGGMGGMPGM